ncbi:hypothetical protein [Leptospira harrisiae]|uniref:hypothetical protein n=1 Tax=Leptospira harrisiae TaxID=2023189 RepID=UPI000C2B2410|nr:hypothetical protein [Leptospira harrisiae]PKA06503.1 hypothetical protein CH366_18845 [Leptospira harrisiae]
MKRQNILIKFLLVLGLNCNYHYSATFVLPKTENKVVTINKNILIRNVSIKDSNIFYYSEILTYPLKPNLKKLLENSNYFEKVSYYNKFDLEQNSKIIDFEFEIYKNKINPKLNLSPISILSFGYYGGATNSYDSEIKLNILIYNTQNTLENKSNFTFSETLDIDPRNNLAFEKMPELKAMFVLNSLLSAFNNL